MNNRFDQYFSRSLDFVNKFRNRSYLAFDVDALRAWRDEYSPESKAAEVCNFEKKFPKSGLPTLRKLRITEQEVFEYFDNYALKILKVKSRVLNPSSLLLDDFCEEHTNSFLLSIPSLIICLALMIKYVLVMVEYFSPNVWQFILILLSCYLFFRLFYWIYDVVMYIIVKIQRFFLIIRVFIINCRITRTKIGRMVIARYNYVHSKEFH